jgi:PPM family protein phosphatase
MTVLRSGSASDVGRVRTVNEDLALETVTLFAVADGMGGHAGGEVASRLAVDTLQGGFRRNPTSVGLIEAVRRANEAVFDRGRTDPDLRGMGTTLTAAALVATEGGDRLVLANVGDSRAYRFSPSGLEQLTTDHSVAEELVARGELSEAEAAVHPHRHILTRALGVAPEVDVDAWEVQPEQGERYLLCSDGLTNEVSADRITHVLANTRDPQQAAETLVRMANEHGGNDNVTVVVVDVVVGDGEQPVPGAPGLVVAPPPTSSTGASGPGSSEAGAGAPDPRAALSGAGYRDLTGVTGSVLAPPAPVAPGSLAPPRATPSLPAQESGRRRRFRRGRRGPRRVTFRVVFFLVLLGGAVYGAYALVNWYGRNTYFVGVDHGELVVYQGRPGGFLWTRPEVLRRTGVTTAQVPQQYVSSLQQGVEESSFGAAMHYVNGLRAYQQSLAPGATTTTPPATTPTTAPPKAGAAIGVPIGSGVGPAGRI